MSIAYNNHGDGSSSSEWFAGCSRDLHIDANLIDNFRRGMRSINKALFLSFDVAGLRRIAKSLNQTIDTKLANIK